MNALKSLVLSSMAVCALCATAAETNAVTNAVKKVPPEKRGEVYMRKFGGFVIDPKSGKGRIGIVNAQKTLPAEELTNVVAGIRKNMKYTIAVREGRDGEGLPTKEEVHKAGFDVAVFVVEDPALPILLAAPDDRWALVNVTKVKAGTKDDILGRRLFALRSRGEVKRAFALACGMGSSSYPGNVYGVTCAEELDTTDVDATIMDMVQRCGSWLAKIGVTPERRVMYLRACHEGWAPAPTNEFQKAIWDKVHALPTEPITIKPEAKKVSE